MIYTYIKPLKSYPEGTLVFKDRFAFTDAPSAECAAGYFKNKLNLVFRPNPEWLKVYNNDCRKVIVQAWYKVGPNSPTSYVYFVTSVHEYEQNNFKHLWSKYYLEFKNCLKCRKTDFFANVRYIKATDFIADGMYPDCGKYTVVGDYFWSLYKD